MDGDLEPLTIVGIVGDIRADNLERTPPGVLYVDYDQRPNRTGQFTLVLHTSAPPLTVAAAARRVRDDLVEGLLLGRGRDNADAGRWAAHLGYDPARDHKVVAIAFEDDVTTMVPPQPAIICGTSYFIARKTPRRLVFSTRSHSATE